MTFSRMDQDRILNEKFEIEQEIIRLNNKPSLSEWEFQTLQMNKQKLRHLRRIMNENQQRH